MPMRLVIAYLMIAAIGAITVFLFVRRKRSAKRERRGRATSIHVPLDV